MTQHSDLEPLKLKGRLAVVTGAGSGIGRAIAIEAALRGMTVALADIADASVQQTLHTIEAAGGKAICRSVDVRNADALCEFAHASIAQFGTPACVFANAGILHYGSILRPDLKSWHRCVDINIMGVVNTIHAFLARMIDAGEPAQFMITGSMGSFVAAPELASYGATKHAIWAMAQCMRMEMDAESRVGISLLAPPRVDTPMLNESEARTRAAHGDDAAVALRGSAMTPDAIAVCALDGVAARQFYVAPQTDDVAPIIRQRIDELLAS